MTLNGSRTTDGAVTMVILCQLQPLRKYSISVSAVTSTTVTGPQVLGSPQDISFWTTFAERPSRPVVVSVSPWTATLSVEPLEDMVSNVDFSMTYVVVYSRNSSSSVGPPMTFQPSPHFNAGWNVGLQLTSEQLNRSRTIQLGEQGGIRLEPGVSYSVSLLAIAFTSDRDIIYSYSWPAVSLTTVPLTTWTQITSTEPDTSQRHSYVHSTMTSRDADESSISAAATHPRDNNFTSPVVSMTSLSATEPSSMSSSSSSSSLMTTDIGDFGSFPDTAVSARTEITWTSTSSSSFHSPADSSSAATAVNMTSLSHVNTTTVTSSDWATVSSATDRDQLSTSGRLTTNGAKLVTSSTTGAMSETRSSLMQSVTTSPRLTTDVVTTATPFIAGES